MVEKILEWLSGLLDILRMPVELQEQAVVLVLKQFDPCLMQGRRVRQKRWLPLCRRLDPPSIQECSSLYEMA